MKRISAILLLFSALTCFAQSQFEPTNYTIYPTFLNALKPGDKWYVLFISEERIVLAREGSATNVLPPSMAGVWTNEPPSKIITIRTNFGVAVRRAGPTPGVVPMPMPTQMPPPWSSSQGVMQAQQPTNIGTFFYTNDSVIIQTIITPITKSP